MFKHVYMEIKFLSILILTLENLSNILDKNVYTKEKQKINSFLANIIILYFLKTLENL